MILKRYKIVANCSMYKTSEEMSEIKKFLNETDYNIFDLEIELRSVILTVTKEDHANKIEKFLIEKGYF